MEYYLLIWGVLLYGWQYGLRNVLENLRSGRIEIKV